MANFCYNPKRVSTFLRVAMEIIERIGAVRAGETVLIIGDPLTNTEIVEALAIATNYLEAHPVVMTIPLPPYPGRYDIQGAVIESVKVSNVSVGITTNSISHTEASVESLKNGHAWLSMNGTTDITMMSSAMSLVGTEKLKCITEKARDALSGKFCRITSDLGTDVTFELSGNLFAKWGELGSRPVYHMCPDGEAGNAPKKYTVNGTVVIDGMQEGCIPLRWPYDQPITYKLKDGKICDVYGGSAAAVFKKTLEMGDEGTWYLGEFAIGTNPEAVMSGALQEDKHCLGTMHFSPGDGGENSSMLHLDGVMIKPTIEIDGKIIIDKGVPKFI